MSMLLNGELEAIKTVISLAKVYGFGNMIAHLRRAWALDLMKNTPDPIVLTYAQATKATDVDPYPEKIGYDL